jgi:hypothetical protein
VAPRTFRKSLSKAITPDTDASAAPCPKRHDQTDVPSTAGQASAAMRPEQTLVPIEGKSG